jgi:serine/threonine-protein kinase
MDGLEHRTGAYTFGAYRLDPVRRILTREGVPVTLTARLFDTLLYLVQNHTRVIARSELASAVWGRRQVDDANVAMAVSSLRKTLQGDESIQSLISTVPRKGFKFAADVTFELAPPAPADRCQAEERASAAAVARPVNLRRLLWASGAAALLIPAAVATMFWREPPVAANTEAPPAFVPPPRSVAVLAFRNESGDPAQEYFSDGISEELINALSQVGGLHVAARSSAFSFKRRPISVPDIARRLNVGAVLSGSVARHGGRLSIDALLSDGVTSAPLWSSHYDRDEGETLKTQEELAEAVTSALRVRLVGADVADLTLGSTTNPRALDAYLRAVAARRNATSDEDCERAIRLFDEAVALDPGFAIAQSERARVLWSFAATTSSNDRAYVRGLKDAALAGAQKAVALAPDLAVAHIALGYALGAYLPDFRRQEREFVRARDLAPGDASVLREYSKFEGFAGHSAKAVEAAEKAVALDPLTAGTYYQLAWAFYWARKPDEAMVALRHATELGGVPRSNLAPLAGEIELMRGNAAAAAADCQQGEGWRRYLCLAVAYHALGRQHDAEAEVGKLDELGADTGPFAYALIYAQWGRSDDALMWLQKSYDLPDQGIIAVPVEPFLDPIRQTPRFKRIERMLDVWP